MGLFKKQSGWPLCQFLVIRTLQFIDAVIVLGLVVYFHQRLDTLAENLKLPYRNIVALYVTVCLPFYSPPITD
jgi:hypothetical protein